MEGHETTWLKAKVSVYPTVRLSVCWINVVIVYFSSCFFASLTRHSDATSVHRCAFHSSLLLLRLGEEFFSFFLMFSTFLRQFNASICELEKTLLLVLQRQPIELPRDIGGEGKPLTCCAFGPRFCYFLCRFRLKDVSLFIYLLPSPTHFIQYLIGSTNTKKNQLHVLYLYCMLSIAVVARRERRVRKTRKPPAINAYYCCNYDKAWNGTNIQYCTHTRAYITRLTYLDILQSKSRKLWAMSINFVTLHLCLIPTAIGNTMCTYTA
jgi:hypothetical protein